MIKYTYGGDDDMTTKSKVFLSIDNLIENIKSKGLKIKDESKLKKILEHNNYYYITGYKDLFKKQDGTYKDNVYFEDIYHTYQFDKKLKLIFAEVLFEIEQDVKTVFMNNFCDRYGYKDLDLVNPSNYDNTNIHLMDVLNRLNNQINWYGKNNLAVSYYKSNYTFVPIWVLIKVLTFGMVRDLIMTQKSNAKDHVCKKVAKSNLKVVEVQNMLELLITYRNICCHDDRLLGYIHKKVNIMNTPYHSKFNLNKNSNGAYNQGKKDMFAALITIKYFTDRKTFASFIEKLSNLVDENIKTIHRVSKVELLEFMNLPQNFTEIKDL